MLGHVHLQMPALCGGRATGPRHRCELACPTGEVYIRHRGHLQAGGREAGAAAAGIVGLVPACPAHLSETWAAARGTQTGAGLLSPGPVRRVLKRLCDPVPLQPLTRNRLYKTLRKWLKTDPPFVWIGALGQATCAHGDSGGKLARPSPPPTALRGSGQSEGPHGPGLNQRVVTVPPAAGGLPSDPLGPHRGGSVLSNRKSTPHPWPARDLSTSRGARWRPGPGKQGLPARADAHPGDGRTGAVVVAPTHAALWGGLLRSSASRCKRGLGQRLLRGPEDRQDRRHRRGRRLCARARAAPRGWLLPAKGTPRSAGPSAPPDACAHPRGRRAPWSSQRARAAREPTAPRLSPHGCFPWAEAQGASGLAREKSGPSRRPPGRACGPPFRCRTGPERAPGSPPYNSPQSPPTRGHTRFRLCTENARTDAVRGRGRAVPSQRLP